MFPGWSKTQETQQAKKHQKGSLRFKHLRGWRWACLRYHVWLSHLKSPRISNKPPRGKKNTEATRKHALLQAKKLSTTKFEAFLGFNTNKDPSQKPKPKPKRLPAKQTSKSRCDILHTIFDDVHLNFLMPCHSQEWWIPQIWPPTAKGVVFLSLCQLPFFWGGATRKYTATSSGSVWRSHWFGILERFWNAQHH